MTAAEREADGCAARGDLAGAQRLLEQAVGDDRDRAEPWLKLASIRRARSDMAGASAAIAEVLRIDPLHFLGLMSRGRLHEAGGQPVEAARDYLRALAQLPPDEPVAPDLAAIVAHARRVGETFRDTVARRWDGIVDDRADLDERARARLARFTSNALKRTRVYHSDPTHYHFPGLVELEFHDRDGFPWLEQLEARTAAIRDEYLRLCARGDGLAEPYVQYDAATPVRQWAALNHSHDWTAFHLLRNGRTVAANAGACPATMETLAAIGQPHVAGRSPNAMFSVLKPHTRIPPHTGVANTRLTCHLPLIVPDGCRFRVGAQTREWRVGEAFVFDDTIEHEAMNDSDTPRIVMIFDIWHPGLRDGERDAVTRLMEAGGLDDGAPL